MNEYSFEIWFKYQRVGYPPSDALSEIYTSDTVFASNGEEALELARQKYIGAKCQAEYEISIRNLQRI